MLRIKVTIGDEVRKAYVDGEEELVEILRPVEEMLEDEGLLDMAEIRVKDMDSDRSERLVKRSRSLHPTIRLDERYERYYGGDGTFTFPDEPKYRFRYMDGHFLRSSSGMYCDREGRIAYTEDGMERVFDRWSEEVVYKGMYK